MNEYKLVDAVELDNTFKNIADAIREKNGTENTYKPSEMPQAIKDIESGGGVDYMPYVKSISFSPDMSEITDDVYLDLSNVSSLDSLFYNVPINCNKVTIKVSSKCINFKRVFMTSSNALGNLKIVEFIGDTSNVTRCDEMFKTRVSLEKILGELDFSSVTTFNDWFMNCSKLKEIYPKSGTIKVSVSFGGFADLTDESIQAIIDGLADMTGADTSPVLTLHKDVKAKLTPEQIATITNKNWTLA